MAAEEMDMHPDCPYCGADDTRRAHRRTLELVTSLLGFFPFCCMQCGARFSVHAIQEERRQRQRLLARAVCAGGVCADSTQEAPSVLVTVRTVGPTADLLKLMDHLSQSQETHSTTAEHPSGPHAIDVKTVGEMFGGSE